MRLFWKTNADPVTCDGKFKRVFVKRDQVSLYLSFSRQTTILNTSFFWFCNMKQLNLRYFNSNSKKIFETVIFFQKEAKTAPKRPILFCLVYQGVFGHFTTIPGYVRKLPKATDDSRRVSKFSED